jgi:hypothetical protein
VIKSNDFSGIDIDVDSAREWTRSSLLRSDSEVASVLVMRLGSFSTAKLLADVSYQKEVVTLSNVGRGLTGSREVARNFLKQLAADAPRTLLVENELGRRGDPGMESRSVFMNGVPASWSELNGYGNVDPVSVITGTSSGWPLNAYVLAGPPSKYQLTLGADLAGSEQEKVAKDTVTILSSVFDGEAFLALRSADERVGLR